MKCRICGEKFDVRGGMAVFQRPHGPESKPRHIISCMSCGITVEKFISDFKKDFSMLDKPLTKGTSR